MGRVWQRQGSSQTPTNNCEMFRVDIVPDTFAEQFHGQNWSMERTERSSKRYTKRKFVRTAHNKRLMINYIECVSLSSILLYICMLDACYQENFWEQYNGAFANRTIWQPGRILKHQDKLVNVNDVGDIYYNILVLWLIVAEKHLGELFGDRNWQCFFDLKSENSF